MTATRNKLFPKQERDGESCSASQRAGGQSGAWMGAVPDHNARPQQTWHALGSLNVGSEEPVICWKVYTFTVH